MHFSDLAVEEIRFFSTTFKRLEHLIYTSLMKILKTFSQEARCMVKNTLLLASDVYP